jgi:RNase P/RNase MRP subunit p29
MVQYVNFNDRVLIGDDGNIVCDEKGQVVLATEDKNQNSVICKYQNYL